MPQSMEFHTGVPDVVDFACRLLRKAYRRGATVLCLAPASRLEALDRALWTFVERDFIPHARLGAPTPSGLLGRTPIWLATSWPTQAVAGLPPRDVVLNLGVALPPDGAGPARVIEIVGADADEVERGRARWRECKAAGVEILHHPFGAGREG
jgi:DNA polymerase-3 subunit chi